MANQKISQLSPITTLASGDYFPVVQSSGTTNKRVGVDVFDNRYYSLASGQSLSTTVSSGLATRYTKAESDSLFALSGVVTSGFNDRYTKAESDSRYALGSIITTTISGKTLVNREVCTVLSGSQTITLPASPSGGWQVSVSIAGTFVNTVLARNGSNIMSLAEDMTLDVANRTTTLLYVDATRGWRIFS